MRGASTRTRGALHGLLMGWMLVTSARAEPPCVQLPAAPIDGLSPGQLQQAWALELVKRAASGALQTTRACPAQTTLRIDAKGRGRRLDGSVLDLMEVPAWERAAVAVRAIFDDWRPTDEKTSPLGKVRLSTPAPTPKPSPATRATEQSLWFGGRVAGIWSLQSGPGTHRGAVTLDLHAGLMMRRLLLGARISVYPPQALPGDSVAQTSLLAVEAGPTASWGWKLGPIALRTGVGVDIAWRESAIEVPTRLDTVSTDDVAVALRLDLELDWMWSPDIGLVLGLSGQGYVSGSGYEWLGESVVASPSVVGAVHLGLRWWIP